MSQLSLLWQSSMKLLIYYQLTTVRAPEDDETPGQKIAGGSKTHLLVGVAEPTWNQLFSELTSMSKTLVRLNRHS